MVIKTSFDALAEGHEKNGILARGVRREEADYVVVVKGEAAGAEMQSVGRKIKLASDDPGFQLHGSISAVAEALEDCLQISEKEHGDAGIGREVLLEAEIARRGAEVTLLQQFQRSPLTVKEVRARK